MADSVRRELKPGLKEDANKIVVEGGQIIKVFKDKNGIKTKEILTKKMDRLDRLLERGL